jgi:hypothetical protein
MPLGRMNVPPSWAQPQQQKEPSIATPIPPEHNRFQTGIPFIPAIPVASAGRSSQGRVREDPEYGHVSKVVPQRHPSGG